jgi:hypothetical protein
MYVFCNANGSGEELTGRGRRDLRISHAALDLISLQQQATIHTLTISQTN